MVCRRLGPSVIEIDWQIEHESAVDQKKNNFVIANRYMSE